MMKIVVTLFLSVFFLISVAQDSNIILTIDHDKITKAEFESIFKKNNRDADVSPEALNEYMELFINFKLKVKEAEYLGLDSVQKFITELKGYRDQLARPYLTDNNQNEALVREAYERSSEEVEASHILINVPANAVPADTLRAWNKINAIRKQALSGKDFAGLARLQSDDPSAKDNGGSLGYFSALKMVYPFESAAYKTPVGQISEPVRTRFGYHIIKVEDRRKNRGEMKAAHIMIRSSEGDSDERKQLAEKQVREIYSELLDGADFAQMALKYSDDGSTSTAGGELPWFGAGKMVEEFEDAAFALNENGEISEPVKSRFGWHIIKRIDHKSLAAFEELKADLEMKVAKDSRSQITRKTFIKKIKDEYGFKNHPANLSALIAKLDTGVFSSDWTAARVGNLKRPLFEIGGDQYTQADFATFLESQSMNRRRAQSTPQHFAREMYKQFEEEAIFEYENSRLEEKYPEFRALMKEYRDGILLFELTDMLIWSRAVKDSVGLSKFYEKHKSDYTYDERAAGVLYFCDNESVAKKAAKMARKGKSQDEIRSKLNKKSDLMVRMEEVKLEQGARPYLNHLDWKEGVSPYFDHNGQTVFFHITQVLAPEPKPLAEVRGLVTAAYQNELEREWIQELRQKYQYTVNTDVLYRIQ